MYIYMYNCMKANTYRKTMTVLIRMRLNVMTIKNATKKRNDLKIFFVHQDILYVFYVVMVFDRLLDQEK